MSTCVEVTFDVLAFQAEPHTAPDGSQLHLPLDLRWQIRDPEGRIVTEINGRTDTDFVYGVGKGWIGGYTYTGTHEGEPIGGTAYLEYARTR